MTAATISAVIPVCNEESFLEACVGRFSRCFDALGRPYEIILVENGSRDGTLALARDLARRDPRLSVLCMAGADRSVAAKAGVAAAVGRHLVAADLDHYDFHFFGRALERLEQGRERFVIGSKHSPGGRDDRPAYRRWSSLAFNGAMRRRWGWTFSDVHGPKVFARETFAAELERSGLPIDVALLAHVARARIPFSEIPIQVEERRPSPTTLSSRLLLCARCLPGRRPRPDD